MSSYILYPFLKHIYNIIIKYFDNVKVPLNIKKLYIIINDKQTFQQRGNRMSVCLNVVISLLTTEPSWFYITLKLIIGAGKINNYFGREGNCPPLSQNRPRSPSPPPPAKQRCNINLQEMSVRASDSYKTIVKKVPFFL